MAATPSTPMVGPDHPSQNSTILLHPARSESRSQRYAETDTAAAPDTDSHPRPHFNDDKDSLEDGTDPSSDASSGISIDAKSRGVVEMEQLVERLSLKWYILLYGGFALLAYNLSLSEWAATLD